MNRYLPFFRNCLPDDQVFVPNNFRSLDPHRVQTEDFSGAVPKESLCQIYTGARYEEARYWSPLLSKAVASVDLSGEYAKVVRLDMGNRDLLPINVFGMVIPADCAHNDTVYAADMSIVESLRARGTYAHPLEGLYMASQFQRILALTLNLQMDPYVMMEFYQADPDAVPCAYDLVPDTQGLQELLADSMIARPVGADERELWLYTPDGYAFGPYSADLTEDDIRARALQALCESQENGMHYHFCIQAKEPLNDQYTQALKNFTDLWLGLVDCL